jgi:hypothetical protein
MNNVDFGKVNREWRVLQPVSQKANSFTSPLTHPSTSFSSAAIAEEVKTLGGEAGKLLRRGIQVPEGPGGTQVQDPL